jgi:hypothetical protein
MTVTPHNREMILKLWLVQRTDGVEEDEIDSMVIASPTSEDAIRLFYKACAHNIWSRQRDLLTTCIGTSNDDKPCIIL